MFLYLAQRGRYWVQALILFWVGILVSSALAPAVAFAATNQEWSQTQINQQIFSKWEAQSNMHWDGGWGAFNSTLSERAGGTCSLDGKAQKALSKFKKGLQDDQKIINDKKIPDKDKPKAFQDAMRYRLGLSPKGQQSNSNQIDGTGQTAMKKLFDTNSVKYITSADDLNGALSASPQLATCNQVQFDMGDLWDQVMPNIIVLFKEPLRFIFQLLAAIPMMFAGGVYALLSKISFGLLLNTPHSERGDTILNTWSSYNSSSNATSNGNIRPIFDSKGNANPKAGNADPGGCNTSAKDQVVNSQLGFSCNNFNESNQKSNTWIGLTNGLRSALSAVYGIIVVGVSLIYLFRRNAQSQYNLKVVMPRLFFAILLSAAAPYLIGAVITTSNFILQSILSVQKGSITLEIARSIIGLTTVDYSGVGIDIGGLVNSLMSIMFPVFLLTFFSIALLYFTFIAVAKQIALVSLILLTPIACLAFVFRDNGKNILALWARGIVGVSAVPVAIAGVIVLGIQLANNFWDPMAAQHLIDGNVKSSLPNGNFGFWAGSLGANSFSSVASKWLASITLMVSMYMAMKMVGKIRKWVTGSKVGMVGRGLGTAVKAGGMVGAAVLTAGGAAPVAGVLAGATSSMGNRMRTGGQDRAMLPSSSKTFGTPSARPAGSDWANTMNTHLGRYSRLAGQEKIIDAASGKGGFGDHSSDKEKPALAAPGSRGGDDGGSSGVDTFQDASTETASSARSAPQIEPAQVPTPENSSERVSTAAAAKTDAPAAEKKAWGRGVDKMRAQSDSLAEKARSILKGSDLDPGDRGPVRRFTQGFVRKNILANTILSDNAWVAGASGMLVGGPLGAAAFAHMAKSARARAAQADDARKEAATDTTQKENANVSTEDPGALSKPSGDGSASAPSS